MAPIGLLLAVPLGIALYSRFRSAASASAMWLSEFLRGAPDRPPSSALSTTVGSAAGGAIGIVPLSCRTIAMRTAATSSAVAVASSCARRVSVSTSSRGL